MLMVSGTIIVDNVIIRSREAHGYGLWTVWVISLGPLAVWQEITTTDTLAETRVK